MDTPAPGSDTPPSIERRMIELWRAASATQKLEKVIGTGRMINELARAELRQRYPTATPREIDLRLASRVLDRDLMIRAFGWDPEVHGR